jgi:hypothetical protein
MQAYEKGDPAAIYYAAREYSNPTEKKARFDFVTLPILTPRKA